MFFITNILSVRDWLGKINVQLGREPIQLNLLEQKDADAR